MNTRINFDTARLLKEKGFDIPVVNFYNEEGGFHQVYNMAAPENMNKVNTSEWYKHNIMYSAPNISEVIMWLYEKHGIWISAFPHHLIENKYCYEVYKSTDELHTELHKFNSPTEAYEVAIEYVLKELV